MNRHITTIAEESSQRDSNGSDVSSVLTIEVLQQREEEINRRVAEIMARLSDESGADTPEPQKPAPVERMKTTILATDKAGLRKLSKTPSRRPRRTSTDSEESQNVMPFPGADTSTKSSGRRRRMQTSFKKPDRTPRAAKADWSAWITNTFCFCNARHQSATDRAKAANAKYERKHLLEQQRMNEYGANAAHNYGVFNDGRTPASNMHNGNTAEPSFHYIGTPPSTVHDGVRPSFRFGQAASGARTPSPRSTTSAFPRPSGGVFTPYEHDDITFVPVQPRMISGVSLARHSTNGLTPLGKRSQSSKQFEPRRTFSKLH